MTTAQMQTFYLATWSESRSNRARRHRWTVEATSLEAASYLARMEHLRQVNHNAGVYVEAISDPTSDDISRPALRERRIEIIDGIEYVR